MPRRTRRIHLHRRIRNGPHWITGRQRSCGWWYRVSPIKKAWRKWRSRKARSRTPFNNCSPKRVAALAANWSGWRSNSTEASCEAGNVRPIKRLAARLAVRLDLVRDWMARFLGVHRSYGGCRIWGPSHQPLGSRQRAFERRPDKLAPCSHAGLVEQLLHGGLNGAHRNAEIGPNLLVRKPCENAQEHLLLSLCQDRSEE